MTCYGQRGATFKGLLTVGFVYGRYPTPKPYCFQSRRPPGMESLLKVKYV